VKPTESLSQATLVIAAFFFTGEVVSVGIPTILLEDTMDRKYSFALCVLCGGLALPKFGSVRFRPPSVRT
jgi:hypothetical protein